MREGIHPDYLETTVVCSCGERFETRTTKGGELHVELCSKCHPFYTGTQKLVDSGGRVQRFSDKFGDAAQATLDKQTAAKEERLKAAEQDVEAARVAREERTVAKAARKAEGEKAAEEAAAKEARRAKRKADVAAAKEEVETGDVEIVVAEEPAAEEAAEATEATEATEAEALAEEPPAEEAAEAQDEAPAEESVTEEPVASEESAEESAE